MPETQTAIASIEMTHVRSTKNTEVYEDPSDESGRPSNWYLKSSLLAGQPYPAKIVVTVTAA